MKPQPDKVSDTLARLAVAQCEEKRTAIWTHYILAHYKATGNLAPGCDAKDLFAWLDSHDVPDWAKSKEKRHG